ncbi:MAG TPA: Rieske 2Fe-2S domain-containing protein, partial [Solirubrobacteraceae bacterium]
IAAYGPTALTGVTDWADTEPGNDPVRRVGLLHAGSNSVALALYTASLRARRRGDRGRGVALGLAGAGVLTAGGFLGGHLSYAHGVGVDQTAFDPGSTEWTDALAVSEVREGEPVAAQAGDAPVLLYRSQGTIAAIHDRCSHRGCSLAGGEVEAGVVECPCHGSRFRLSDGQLVRGPATVPQPAFDARERDGRVEVRRRT